MCAVGRAVVVLDWVDTSVLREVITPSAARGTARPVRRRVATESPPFDSLYEGVRFLTVCALLDVRQGRLVLVGITRSRRASSGSRSRYVPLDTPGFLCSTELQRERI